MFPTKEKNVKRLNQNPLRHTLEGKQEEVEEHGRGGGGGEESD